MAKPTTPWDLDISKFLADLKLQSVDLNVVLAAQRKNLEALTTANKLAFEGAQAIARRLTEVLGQLLEDTSSAVAEVAAAPTPEQKMAKQVELGKVAFEKALSNLKELSELLSKSNTEAADVINKRISESLDEIKALASKKPA